jgi:hypothetical protein
MTIVGDLPQRVLLRTGHLDRPRTSRERHRLNPAVEVVQARLCTRRADVRRSAGIGVLPVPP